MAEIPNPVRRDRAVLELNARTAHLQTVQQKRSRRRPQRNARIAAGWNLVTVKKSVEIWDISILLADLVTVFVLWIRTGQLVE